MAAPRTVLPGVKARHAIISDACRRNRGDAGAIAEALGRLGAEFAQLAGHWPVGSGANFHVVLTVERPEPPTDATQTTTPPAASPD